MMSRFRFCRYGIVLGKETSLMFNLIKGLVKTFFCLWLVFFFVSFVMVERSYNMYYVLYARQAVPQEEGMQQIFELRGMLGELLSSIRLLAKRQFKIAWCHLVLPWGMMTIIRSLGLTLILDRSLFLQL